MNIISKGTQEICRVKGSWKLPDHYHRMAKSGPYLCRIKTVRGKKGNDVSLVGSYTNCHEKKVRMEKGT